MGMEAGAVEAGRKDEVAAGGGRTLNSSAPGGTGAAAARPKVGGGTGRSPPGPAHPCTSPARSSPSPSPAGLSCSRLPPALCSLRSISHDFSRLFSTPSSTTCSVPHLYQPSGSLKGPPLSALTTWSLTAVSVLGTRRRSH